jgi:hypothetical protein
VIFLYLRYAILDTLRAQRSTRETELQDTVTYVANGMYFIALLTMSLIFVFQPKDNLTAHALAFLQIGPFLWLVVAANFYEVCGARVTRSLG